MHLYSENLAIEIANYYRNLSLGHGVIPKVFTLVNAEGDQYLFFIDDLRMEKQEETQFLSYIVQTHDAVSYARGTLIILDKKQELVLSHGDLSVYFFDEVKNYRNDDEECSTAKSDSFNTSYRLNNKR